MTPTVAIGGGAVVHPVLRPSLTTDADASTDDDDDVATTECFICTKPVQTSQHIVPATAQGLACDCLAHHALHQACFDEWYNKQRTCPFCRSVGADTDAIRLHIRETVATLQHEAEEQARRNNRRLVVVGALGVCAMLCAFAFLLLHHNPDHHVDDDWQHTHDDTQSTTPGVWYLLRE